MLGTIYLFALGRGVFPKVLLAVVTTIQVALLAMQSFSVPEVLLLAVDAVVGEAVGGRAGGYHQGGVVFGTGDKSVNLVNLGLGLANCHL